MGGQIKLFYRSANRFPEDLNSSYFFVVCDGEPAAQVQESEGINFVEPLCLLNCFQVWLRGVYLGAEVKMQPVDFKVREIIRFL